MAAGGPISNEEIDKLMAAHGIAIPDQLAPRIRDACRTLKTLALTLTKPRVT